MRGSRLRPHALSRKRPRRAAPCGRHAAHDPFVNLRGKARRAARPCV